MLKRWNTFINESKETIVSKRIQFLKDKFLDLKDEGYDVSVELDQMGSFFPRKMTIAVIILDKYPIGSHESTMTYIQNREEVKSLIDGLAYNRIGYRSSTGGYVDGRQYLKIQFDRYGNSCTVPVRMLEGLENFKHKKGELLQKRINFLEDKLIDLKDMGLDIQIGESIVYYKSDNGNLIEHNTLGIFIKDYDSILDNEDYYENLLVDKKEIKDIISNFKDMNIIPLRIESNGNDGCIIHFAKTGHGKNTIPVRYL